MTKIFKLNEIDCPICAAKAEKRVSKIKGLTAVNVDFMTQRLVVEADDITESMLDDIVAAVQKIEPDCEVTPL